MLERFLERAKQHNLRLKLSRCYFAQFAIEALGVVAGMGVVRPDPKKVQGIVAWPRPSRLDDVEKFLATNVFIREHLSPRYNYFEAASGCSHGLAGPPTEQDEDETSGLRPAEEPI